MTSQLPVRSYKLHHTVTNRVDKPPAAHMSPFPHQPIPFASIDGPDNRCGQMHAPLRAHTYKDASTKGFMSYEAYKEIPKSTTSIVTPEDCKFPSLTKLNDEIFPWESGEQHKVLSYLDEYLVYEAFPISVLDAPAPKPAPLAPVVPDIGTHASPGSSSQE